MSALTQIHMPILRPFFWDYSGKLVPEELFFQTL